ncbi:MAG: HepT-like ribonuclease domain-containing protein [Beijerinckiaceae bacterium]
MNPLFGRVNQPETVSDIPWQKVAGIGNVLRHDYERIAPDVLWKLAQVDLLALDRVCRDELAAALARDKRE